MTVMSPEEIEQISLDEFEDIEVPCDISKLKYEADGYPPCKGDPARWIAYRTTGCCGRTPNHRLVCDFCKRVYQKWMAMHAVISCAACGQETGGFIHYEPLRKL